MNPPQNIDDAAEQLSASKRNSPPVDQLWIPVAIALLAIIVRAWMAWSTHSTTEDFYITVRYAENIAHGAGFVYNHGQRVLGTTTPLYTLLLALSAWLHNNPVVVGKLINIAADGASCFLMAYLTARPEIGHPRAGQFAALLYAFSSTPISITIGGMETGIVTCVCMAMVTSYVTRSTRVLYILGAILFLLRIDGLVLFGLLAAGLAYQQRRIPWRDIALGCFLAAPWLVFATAYFGSPIPTSLTAKLFVYSHAMATPRSVTLEAFRTQFAGGKPQVMLSILFVVGVIAILLKTLWETPPHLTSPTRGEEPVGPLLETRSLLKGHLGVDAALNLRAALGAPVVWLCIYYLTMFSSRVPPFPWYFLPPWPIYLIVAMLGATLVLGWLPISLLGSSNTFKKRAAYAGLLAIGMYGAVHLKQVRNAISQDQTVEDTLRMPLGLWFHDHAQPNERILLEPIGYVGYFSQRPILDMIGLVSPEVFPSYRTPNALSGMITRFHPEWLCIRPAEMETIRRDDNSLLERSYVYVREFHAAGRKPDFLIYHIRSL